MSIKEEKGFFEMLTTGFTAFEYKLLFTIATIYSLVGASIIGFPLWYKDPDIYCKLTGEYELCSESQACQTEFYIDENGPQSLSTQFSLVCSNSNLKRFSQWILLFGMYIGCVVNLFSYVSDRKLQRFICFCALSFAVFGLLTLIYPYNIYWVSICLGIALNFIVIIMTQAMSLLNKIFTEEQTPTVVAVANTGWAIFTVIYSIVALVVDSNWKVLIGFGHIIMLIAGIYLFTLPVAVIKEERKSDFSKAHPEIEETNINIFKSLLRKKDISKNFFIYAFLGVANFFTLSAFPFELESIGGSLYLNLIFLSILDTFSCLFSGYIGVKFPMLSVMKNNNSILILFLCYFFFIPLEKTHNFDILQGITVLISLICMLLYSNSVNLSLMCNRQLLTNKYINISMIFQMLLSRIVVQALPFINYLFREQLNLHPYIFILIIWIIARIMMNYLVIVEKDEIKDLELIYVEEKLINNQNDKN